MPPGRRWWWSSIRCPASCRTPRDNSCFPKAARAAGLDYDELIQTVADIAWRRITGQRLLAEVAA